MSARKGRTMGDAYNDALMECARLTEQRDLLLEALKQVVRDHDPELCDFRRAGCVGCWGHTVIGRVEQAK